MVVLTIIFLTMSLVTLLKGRMFNGLYAEIVEENIKMNTIKDHKFNTGLLGKVLLFVLYGLGLLVVQLIYLSNALDYDIYKYPTLVMLFLLILGIIKPLATTKKNTVYDEETIRKERAKIDKKRTPVGVLRNILSLAYYSYILYLLVF